MDAKLSVEVGAKIDELQKAMLAAGASVSNFAGKTDTILAKLANDLNVSKSYFQLFGDKVQKNVSQLNAYNSALKELLQQGFRPTSKEVLTVVSHIDRLNKTLDANAGRGGLGGFAKGASQANIAVLELSRGIQDAPYGSMGYINNLQQFQQLFGQLVKETGSFKGALKALGSSLIGPAGIGVAFSVVTAAITVYSMWQQKADREAGKATKTNEEYADSLDAVSQAQLKGAQSAQTDLVQLRLLYEQTQNVTLSQKQRLRAVNELQAKYPAYFANIKDEAILAGQAAGKYNELSTAILASAKARAATDLIVKNQQRKLENEQKILDLQNEQIKNEQALASLRTRVESAQGNAVVGLARDMAGFEVKITENRTAQRNLASDILLIDQKSLQLLKSVNKEIEKGVIDTSKPEKAKAGKTAIDIKQERLNLYIKGLEALQKMEGQAVEKLREDIGKQMPSTKPLISMDSILPANMAKNVARELSLINFELIAFNERASEIIQNSIVGTFDGIGDAIGEALSGGKNVIEGLSHTLLAGLGGLLVNLGKLAIATGVGIQAIKTAFKTLNPLVAIGAGVALVALGSAISKSVSKLGDSKLPGFATGVENFKGGLAIVGERGPEVVNLPQGSDVIPNHRSRGLLGGDSGGYIAETRVDLESLWIGIRKAEKRISLLGG